MMPKSQAVSRKSKPAASEDLRLRAKAIIRNKTKYDAATRAAIMFQLEAGYPALAQSVSRVERGAKITGYSSKETFDELKEQSVRAVNALLNCRGVPVCIKRVLADSLEEAAMVIKVDKHDIWEPYNGTAVANVHPDFLWKVFESKAVRDLFDLPRTSDPVEKASAKVDPKSPKSKLNKLKKQLQALDEFEDPDVRVQLETTISRVEREAQRDEWPDVIGG